MDRQRVGVGMRAQLTSVLIVASSARLVAEVPAAVLRWPGLDVSPRSQEVSCVCVLQSVMSCCEICSEDIETTPAPNAECLKERKWWCFLLSSIFTFLAGLLIVLLWRVFAFLCCRKEPEFSPNDPKQKEQKAARGKQEFEGTFMTEAKDWAGELISGQTTTGRILVSTKYYLLLRYFLNCMQSCGV